MSDVANPCEIETIKTFVMSKINLIFANLHIHFCAIFSILVVSHLEHAEFVKSKSEERREILME